MLRQAAFVSLLFLIIGLLESAVLSSRNKQYPYHSPSAQQRSEQIQQEQPWDLRAAHDPVAVFTFFLVVIAAGQVVLFWWQLGLIREGAADATRAAETAVTQATIAQNQLVLANRPRIIIRRISLDNFGQPNAKIQCIIANTGGTRATIVRAEAIAIVIPAIKSLPAVPNWDNTSVLITEPLDSTTIATINATAVSNPVSKHGVRVVLKYCFSMGRFTTGIISGTTTTWHSADTISRRHPASRFGRMTTTSIVIKAIRKALAARTYLHLTTLPGHRGAQPWLNIGAKREWWRLLHNTEEWSRRDTGYAHPAR